jgi:photosystem II stability/assembly factor-like uncharacterized protein
MKNNILSFCGAVCLGLAQLSASRASAQSVLFHWTVSEFQPDIAEGGRANTIAVNPANNDHIIVATETGGLFRSTNRGVTWKHVDGLPEFRTSSVAFVPADTSVIIATVGEDTRVANGGGIWRSTNSGLTWAQLPGPPAPAGATTRLSAFDISIAPDNGTIYVGTQYGVSISHDRGVTWTHTDPYAGGDHRAFSVLAQSGNHVIVASSDGIRRSNDGGTTWLLSTTGTGPGTMLNMHALGGSPFADDQAYAVNFYRMVYFTEDAGDHWTRIMSAYQGFSNCGGIAFVKAIGRISFGSGPLPRPRSVELYSGNKCELERLTAPQIAGTNRFDYSGLWKHLALDHADTRDLAFTNGRSRQPLLLGTDGGLHKTVNGGLNWSLTGGGHNGYNALQITEVKGQWITTIPRYDLYFGTQDNHVWASGNVGSSWINPTGGEGFFIETQRQVATPSDSKTTFVTCGACINNIADPLLTNVLPWPNPTTPSILAPKIVRKSFHVQAVDSGPAFMAKGLAVTTDLGSTWSQYAAFLEDWRELPKLSDPGTLPVLYQAVRTGYDIPRDFEIDQLVRIKKSPVGPGGDVTYPLMNNFGGLGINPTNFAWYMVFAVDPGNTQHLIAPDVINEKMMQSADGGDNWTEIPNLGSLITNGGEFYFNRSIFPQASAISFSADDPNVVIIGTWQAGLFASGDRGVTWWKIPDSDLVTYITSVEFSSANDAIISTYGRGLWRIHWGMIKPLIDLDKLCKAPCIFLPIPPVADPIEKLTHAVLVFGGQVQGARISSGALRELFVSPGSSVAFFSDTRKTMDVKVTESRKVVGFGRARVPKAPERRKLVGLTLGERGNLISAAYAEKTLSMYEPSDQEKMQGMKPSGRKVSPTADKPYLRVSMPGGSGANTVAPEAPIRISGRNFPRGASVEIAIDHVVVERVKVGDTGEFALSVKAPRELGLHSVTARDAAGNVIDGANFIVKAEDTRKR